VKYSTRAANWVAPRDEEMGRDTPPKSGATTPQIYEAERGPRDTGLLDANGNKIMAMEPAIRIGFLP
jgi:hypothetical protein